MPLVRDAEGNFYYATISADKRLVSSNILAHNEADRNEIEKNFIKTAQEAQIENVISEIHKACAQRYSEMRKAGAATILPEGEVNVPVLLVEYSNTKFSFTKEELDAKFVKESTAAGFINLKGHRTKGGMRASVYNAMPIEGVEKLVEFMKKFEAENA